MSHRVKFILKDEIWDALQTLPKSERNVVGNEALARWIEWPVVLKTCCFH